ncbi:hypothetical protein NE626_16205, partial [Intestinimonas massiliensis]|nr:hypothetical protein [Intestinimonas massiliensis (ex Afouda et al. 2020)]
GVLRVQVLRVQDQATQHTAGGGASPVVELTVQDPFAGTYERYASATALRTAASGLDPALAFFGRDAMANYCIIGSRQLGAEVFGDGTLVPDKDVFRRLW